MSTRHLEFVTNEIADLPGVESHAYRVGEVLLHDAPPPQPPRRLVIIDAGHFVWEDAADEYAALVTRWWHAGHANTGHAASVAKFSPGGMTSMP